MYSLAPKQHKHPLTFAIIGSLILIVIVGAFVYVGSMVIGQRPSSHNPPAVSDAAPQPIQQVLSAEDKKVDPVAVTDTTPPPIDSSVSAPTSNTQTNSLKSTVVTTTPPSSTVPASSQPKKGGLLSNLLNKL